MERFATSAEELDVDFLSEAIGCAVADFRCEPIGNGLVGDSLRISLSYHDEERAAALGAPRSIAAKFPASDPTSRATARAMRLYAKEVGFYREIAPQLAVRAPRVYFARWREEDDGFALLMEDCGPARQGDQLEGCSFDEAAAALRELAALHAGSFDREGVLGHDFLAPGEAAREFARAGYTAAVERFLTIYADAMSARDLAIIERSGELCEQIFAPAEDEAADARCVIHGDFRLDNMLFAIHGGAEPVAILDWQTVSLGDPGVDLGYFLGAGIGPSLRRAHGKRLIEIYEDAYAQIGAPRAEPIAHSEGFARGSLHGVTTAVFSAAFVEDNARARAIFQSMAEGACDLVAEIDAFRIFAQD